MSGTIQANPWLRPLKLLEEALRLLDELDASAEIAAHLDLAICRLKESKYLDSHLNILPANDLRH